MISLSSITKTYSDGTRALRGVDLEIGAGLTGLLGPNGAGKTTLLSILTLAQEPTSGRRTYGGLDDARRHRPEIRRMIGYLPQEFEPVEGLTGTEYLELCARWRQVPLRGQALGRRIRRLLEAVELGEAARRRADTYSGGMVRRLGLAQAILHAPKFLVVDEPTAGLDPEERIRFRTVITDLADEIPILLSTHIVEDIEATCPRLAILAHGGILFDGSPSELMRRVEGRLWRLGASWEGSAEDRGAAGLTVGSRVDSCGVAFEVVLAGEPPADAEAVEPSLEEACSAFLARAHEESP
ncbi:MAG: ATP-binding cassette domain-containing protein [Acidobacteriota bacterium]